MLMKISTNLKWLVLFLLCLHQVYSATTLQNQTVTNDIVSTNSTKMKQP